MVEHDRQKAILVANEKEIGKQQRLNNLEYSDMRYNQIKEKAIGLTIRYEPSLTDLFDEVLAVSTKKKKSKKVLLYINQI